jgi:hypothetical protein
MLQNMEQGLDKANVAILGLHHNFSAMCGIMAHDIHAFDCCVERLQTTIGLPKSMSGVRSNGRKEASKPPNSGVDNLSNTEFSQNIENL